MIVFDLRCTRAHVFEAWFSSGAAYEEQRARGLLACPICGDGGIAKAVMAPNVGAKGNTRSIAPPFESRPGPRPGSGLETPPGSPSAPDAPPSPAQIKAALQTLARAQIEILAKSEWVGPRFADRARAMHEGSEPAVPIHGETTLADAKALIADGVAVAPLPLPFVPPEVLN